MPVLQLIPSFNAGEISPLLDARVSLDKYQSGCRTLQNFLILPYGGAMRRPGTEYLGAAKNSDSRARLVGFNFSSTTSFILEIGEKYIRFWSNGVQVVAGDTGPAPLEVATPYEESHLRDLQFVQVNDIMYFVHPAFSPRKLTRSSDTSWTFAEVAWTWPVFLDENTEPTTITPYPVTFSAWVTAHSYAVGDYVTNSGSLYRCISGHTSGTFTTDLTTNKYWVLASISAGTSVTLTASAPIFTEQNVGSYFSISYQRASAYTEVTMAAASIVGTPLDVLGDWELTTYGNWKGSLKVERSYDGTSWETLRTYVSSVDGERNVSTTGTEDKPCKLRLNWAGLDAGSNTPHGRLEVGDNRLYGTVKITGCTVDSASTTGTTTTASATVINDLHSYTATKLWAEGAFSDRRGYPRTITLHEQRLIFAGTRHKPLSVWGSVTDDFENFRYSTNDDGAFMFTLSANESNSVNWMTSQTSLLIGTAGDEWTLGATDTSQSLTPTNVQARRQSSYGSKYMQARVVNEVIMFIQRQGRKIRELTYAFEKNGWVAPDLTLLANHITQGEIVETAFQQQPDAILWAVTGDGRLIGMTYERDQNVVGWHRHTTGERTNTVTVELGRESTASTPIPVRGDWSVSVAGIWSGNMAVMCSRDDGSSWQQVRTFDPTSSAGQSGKISGRENAGALYRVLWTPPESGGEEKPVVTLSGDSADTFESVATIYGGSGSDEVWFLVKRAVGGRNIRYIERFKSDHRETLDAGDKPDWWYLDCAKQSTATPASATVDGLDHLEGLSVGVLKDGATHPERTVTGGTITLQSPAEKVLAGLPFESVLQPMKLNIDLQDGTSQGRRARVPRLVVRFYKSLGGKYSTDGNEWFAIFARGSDPMDDSPPVFTGEKKLYTGGTYADSADIWIKQDLPMPMVVLAVIPKWEATGD